ncbi:MAG: ABC transporter ATP-binding protein [Ignavibacteriales bacterium]|nr:MAG: ABC transporter ATP-binding protein [Ignavibacteriales bacterium]
MTDYSVKAELLRKNFGRRLIFQNLSFHFSENGIYGIAGANGSGKSTLVKMISGITSASSGKIIHSLNGTTIIEEKLHNYIGFVSPYLIMYDEFTAEENLRFVSHIRGIIYNREHSEWLLELFGIYNRRNDAVKTYSSGMKQRLKFVFAFLHSPHLILLDEPTSNLDHSGKDVVYKLIKSESQNKIIIIASNEENDLSLSSSIIDLENYKTGVKEGNIK